MQLYNYQHIGVDHLVRGTGQKPHAMLADAPGLGKTLQACAALKRVNAQSALIITPAPRAIKNSWRKTLLSVIPDAQIQVVNSGKDVIGNAPFIIINYELLQNDDLFRTVYWRKYDAIIIDEAQRLKSLDSARSLRILGKDSQLIARGWHKWFLTGTPLVNRPVELFPILSTMVPELLGVHRDWKRYIQRYCNAFIDERGWVYNGASNVEELAKKISPFVLRREVEDVYKEMPNVVESDLFIDLGDMENDETNTETATLRKMVGTAKLPYIIEYLQWRGQESSEKILCFTFHRFVSESISRCFNAPLIYGGINSEQKQQAIDVFTQGNAKILVAQINSAGEGLDGLQHVCNNVVFAEPDWVPGGYDQQIGRLRRIGQTKPVHVVSLIAENTLEESIVASRRAKQRNIDRLYTNLHQGVKEMSLEDALKENTEAMKALTAALSSSGVNVSVAKAEAPKAETNGGKKAKEEKIEKAKEPEFTVDDLRAAGSETIIMLGETDENRARLQAVCKKFGSPTGKADGVPKKNIGACIEAIKALADVVVEEEPAGAGI